MHASSSSTKTTTHLYRDFLFILLTIGCFFFALIGVRPLFTPDEGRYAEIAREMLVRNDFITPYLNGIHYFEKPVLYYWLSALALKIGGLHLWVIRSVNGLLSTLGILTTYYSANILFNRRTGLLSAFILATSLLYFVMTHMVSLDLPVSVFLNLSLCSFILGVENQTTKKRYFFWLAYFAAGLAMLTKGLIGIVFPMMIILPWLVMSGKWREIRTFCLPSGILIFLLTILPWHIVVQLRNPGFFHFYFIEQHLLRYTTKEIGHYQPSWFFLPVLILGFFPWIAFLPQAIANAFPFSFKALRTKQKPLFFLLWVVLIFLFFSFSKSKLIPYILPIFPPLSVLVACYLDQALREQKHRGLKFGYVCLLLLSTLVAYTYLSFLKHNNLPDLKTATIYLSLAAFVLVAGVAISFICSYYRPKVALKITIMAVMSFSLLSLAAVPAIDTRTILPLAQQIKPLLTSQDEVITYNQYYQDLPFYLERRVNILNWQNELTYGMSLQDTRQWMINDETFWQRWHSAKRLYVFISKDEYKILQKNWPKEKIYVIGSTINTILISNKLNTNLLPNISHIVPL